MNRKDPSEKRLEEALGDALGRNVAEALAEIPVWTCRDCGAQNWRERCQRCFALKPKKQ